MRISLNWLKKYVSIPVSNEELIRLIGARLVEVEGVIDESAKYNNIYVAKVVNAEKIPDTHLTLCQVYVGDKNIEKVEKDADGLVQVVCGAPNVHVGMLAAWIAPGAIVPASVHEDAPFVIGKRKMLGKYDSFGMLAGADELDFGGDHSGIVEIDPTMAQPGDLLSDVFELNDLILEIENKSLTHRPDCFGIIGFAREVAGILGEKFAEPEFLTVEKVFPKGFFVRWGDGIKAKKSELTVEIADPEICPRYSCAVIKVVDPVEGNKYLSEMQILLAKSGMQSISKIVDVTNYLMLLTGQPLHAFDYDKFLSVGGSEKPIINVRLAREGEKLELLDGKEVSCIPSDILITSNDVPVAMAGAMGGKSTEIDENTNNVLLESATFSLFNLRKTQMEHGIFSEAITRFTKGVPAGGTFNVLAEAIKEINGKPLDACDAFVGWKKPQPIIVSVGEINELLGTDYSKKLIMQTLSNVGFDVENNGDVLTVWAKIWRTDIHIKEDIIEEVGRLLGYDNITPTLPRHATAERNKMLSLKTQIREIMKEYGANEVLAYSFVSERLLKKAGLDVANSYKIVNSISPDLQYVRQTIVPSLLDKAYLNQKLPVDKFAIFEMNKVYQKGWGMNDENVPVEKMQMGFVVAERKTTGDAYYKAKFYAEKLLEELNIAVKFLPLKSRAADALPFENKRAAEIWTLDDQYVGVVGEFKNSVRRNFKLAEYLAGFELSVDVINKLAGIRAVKNDFEIKDQIDETVTTDKNYADVLAEVSEKYPGAVITPASIYQPEGVSKKNITFHIEKY
ncbi:phenylalanine--tRNA ligase subunit beta [Candidatus Saccharibacteria bacterium]|nr:phenylalanine--tRNA ligase subunit beta [Candidatus Saccharibacteria bacterium]